MSWKMYMERYGHLDSNVRREESNALIAFLLARLLGHKQAKIEDFIPDRDMKEASFSHVAGLFKKIKAD